MAGADPRWRPGGLISGAVAALAVRGGWRGRNIECGGRDLVALGLIERLPAGALSWLGARRVRRWMRVALAGPALLMRWLRRMLGNARGRA